MQRAVVVAVVVTVALAKAWVPQTSNTTNTLNAVWFADGTHGWAVGDSGTSLMTEDGGSTWSPFSLTNQDLEDVAFMGRSVGLIVGDDGRIFRTSNGGQNWSQVTSGTSSNLRAVALGTGGRAYAAGEDGVILRSTDEGAAWSVVETGSVCWEGLFGVDDQRAYVVGREGNIKVSGNGGASWRSQTSGTAGDLKDVYFTGLSNGWAVGQSGLPYPYYEAMHTSTGGTLWGQRGVGINFNLEGVNFVSTDQGWVVGDAGAIYHTTNQGMSWAFEPSGVSVELNDVFFMGVPSGWAVGDSGTILHRQSTGVEELPRAGVLGSAEVRPNPVTARSNLTYSIGAPGRVEVRVVDAVGRVVRVLARGTVAAGRHEMSWDRSDNAGRVVGPGVYFYDVRVGKANLRRPVVVVGSNR